MFTCGDVSQQKIHQSEGFLVGESGSLLFVCLLASFINVQGRGIKAHTTERLILTLNVMQYN